MSPEPISPTSTQILLIDHQPEIVPAGRTNPPASIIKAAVGLAKIGTLLDLPILVSVVPLGDAPPRLVPELAEVLPGVKLLARATPDVFRDAPSKAALAAAGRPDLIIAGVVTEAAVVFAALGALAAGYRVQVAVDACGGVSARTENATLRRLEAAGAITTSTVTVGATLVPEFVSPTGQQMLGILMSLLQ